MTSGRRQNSRKFGQTECEIESDSRRWAEYWRVLEGVLQERHQALPTHRLDEMVDGQAMTEASGGVSEVTVAAIGQTGVDIISVGALTHSAPALDISLDLRPI